ncbi:hypothetical protein ACSXBY_09665 [Clostridium perfringens]
MCRDIAIQSEVRESWFKNHIAQVEVDLDDLKVINWGGPGTNLYRVRYVFDRNKVYISGDIEIYEDDIKITLLDRECEEYQDRYLCESEIKELLEKSYEKKEEVIEILPGQIGFNI